MANEVKVDVAAFNRFINRVVQPYLRTKADQIAAEVRRAAPKGATNELANSVRVDNGPKGSVRISVTAPHAGFVSEGTGPQANPPRPQYYPRLRRRGLILWSDSKGLNPQAVAHSIAQKGTAPNPYFEQSVARILGQFNFRWITRNTETK